MSNKLIVGNLKMNILPKKIDEVFKIKSDNKIVLCAPYIYLESLIKKSNNNVEICAENVFNKEDGNYTGEISIGMLKDIGIKYCLIGHPERRYIEPKYIINEKVLLCLKNDITPIVCIGSNMDKEELNKELNIILQNVSKDEIKKIILAFEPSIAINNIALDTKLIKENIDNIRKKLTNMYDNDISNKVKILYGGSVNSFNSKEILEITDGILVGKACLDIDEFIKTINS